MDLKIFDDKPENKKQISKVFIQHIHYDNDFAHLIQLFFTHLDKLLYSTEFRNQLYLQTKLSDLLDSEQTRNNIYKFYVKGSNVLTTLRKYLEIKTQFKFEQTNIPDEFVSDWDSGFLINPNLTQEQFEIIRENVIRLVLKEMVQYTKILQIPSFYKNMKESNTFLHTYIYGPESESIFEKFNGWKFSFNKDEESKPRIFDEKDPLKKDAKNYGVTGKGFRVTSSRVPFENANFYLARIIGNVDAIFNNSTIKKPMPIEVIDFSLSYERNFEWNSHREYRIQYNDYDYRILSAVSYYVDQAKTLSNTLGRINLTENNKTRKINNRIKYVKTLLENIIIPYDNLNTDIQDTIYLFHNSENSFVSKTTKTLQKRMQNKKIENPTNVFESE